MTSRLSGDEAAPEGVLIPIRIISDPDISNKAFRVYAALLALAGPEGACRPTNRRLAEMAGGLTLDMIRRSLRELEAVGLIVVPFDEDRCARDKILIVAVDATKTHNAPIEFQAVVG